MRPVIYAFPTGLPLDTGAVLNLNGKEFKNRGEFLQAILTCIDEDEAREEGFATPEQARQYVAGKLMYFVTVQKFVNYLNRNMANESVYLYCVSAKLPE